MAFYTRGDKKLTAGSDTSAIIQEFENERDALETAFQAVSDEIAGAALLAGRASGQILNGGVAAGEDLGLESTTNVTKGNVNIGLGTGTAVQVGGFGATLGVLGTTPIVKQPAINLLLNSTGGVVNGILEAVPAVNGSGATTAQEAAINNNFAELHTKFESLRAAVTAFGFLNLPE